MGFEFLVLDYPTQPMSAIAHTYSPKPRSQALADHLPPYQPMRGNRERGADLDTIRTGKGGLVLRTFYAWCVGISGGASLLFLGHKYFGANVISRPMIKIDYAVIGAPTVDPVTDSILAMIKAARTEVLVAARQLASKALLEALAIKAKEGVRVAFLLDEHLNPHGSSLLRWLDGAGFEFVFVDPLPLYNQFIVVDRTRIAIGAAPFTAEARLSSTLFLVVENADVGGKFAAYFEERARVPKGGVK